MQVRITPAGAGKRRYTAVCGHGKRDHPRGCGEKLRSLAVRKARAGSPPRVRGKVLYFSQNGLETGITPAGAGKRLVVYALAGVEKDHPRGCGEKCLSRPFSQPLWGSPPRVRGKAITVKQGNAVRGITPAGAGKSCWPRWFRIVRQDHPRGCGEKRDFLANFFATLGSPPRVRGKVIRQVYGDFVDGITPAGAGKSFSSLAVLSSAWDHPRGCGEKMGESK